MTANLDYRNGKALARHIVAETMSAIDVRQAMQSKLRREGQTLIAGNTHFEIGPRARVVAFGKAANRMAATLQEMLGDQARGVVVSPVLPEQKLLNFQYFAGGHPYPDEGSLSGAAAALELLRGLTPDDAVIFLVSGGGSAIFEMALDPAVTLDDLSAFNRVLVTGHLPIEHINTLRKHLSAVKGGRLAAAAYPARRLTIYISDVPDDMPSMIASGPTFPDESTVDDCYRLNAEHELAGRFPVTIRRRLEERTLEETPKPGNVVFENSRYFPLLSNKDAVGAAIASAQRLGFHSERAPEPWDGDFRQVADTALHRLEELRNGCPRVPLCLALGGEVTSPVTGPGTGGRNQAFALYAALGIANRRRVVVSAATDGRDGNSPAAGAIGDGETLGRAHALALDPQHCLDQSDSYNFFKSLQDTLETGLTDNNVRDVRLYLDFED
jgi:hydroxypyruvate reductase